MAMSTNSHTRPESIGADRARGAASGPMIVWSAMPRADTTPPAEARASGRDHLGLHSRQHGGDMSHPHLPVGFRLSVAALATVAAIGVLNPAARAQTRTVAQIANYAGADRQKVLEDGARKEGALLIYTTGTQIQPVIDRFKQRYPYLRVELARAPSADVASKVVEEYAAGVYLADTFELAAHGLLIPRDLGILQPFTSPEATNYEAAAIETNHHWISVREGYTGIGFNTQKIAPTDAPKTYLDLLDPKWKGKMAISSLSVTAANWVGTMIIAHGLD